MLGRHTWPSDKSSFGALDPATAAAAASAAATAAASSASAAAKMPGNSINAFSQTYSLLNQLRAVGPVQPASSQAQTQYFAHGLPNGYASLQQAQLLGAAPAAAAANAAAANAAAANAAAAAANGVDTSAVLSQILSLIDSSNLPASNQASLLNLLAQQQSRPQPSPLPPPPMIPLGLQATLGSPPALTNPLGFNPGGAATAAPNLASTVPSSSPVQQFQESIQLQVKRMRFSTPQDAAISAAAAAAAAASKTASYPPTPQNAGLPVAPTPGAAFSAQRTLQLGAGRPSAARFLTPVSSTTATATTPGIVLVNGWKPERRSPDESSNNNNNNSKTKNAAVQNSTPLAQQQQQQLVRRFPVTESLYDPAQPTPAEDLEISTAIVAQRGNAHPAPSALSPAVSVHGAASSAATGRGINLAMAAAAGVPMTADDVHRLAAQQEAARMENLLLQLRNPGMFALAGRPTEQIKPEEPKKKEYCTVCSCYLDQPLLLHRRSKEHKKKKEHMYPRCRKCNIRNFENRAAYEEHCKSEDHRKSCEAWAIRRQQLQQQQEGGGGGGEEDGVDEEAGEAAALVTGADVEGFVFEDIAAPSTNDAANDADAAGTDAAGADADGDAAADATAAVAAADAAGSDADASSSEPVGQEFVVAMTGFYCKLCSQFYHEETEAKVHHCMTPAHLTRYQDLLSALSTSLLRGDAETELASLPATGVVPTGASSASTLTGVKRKAAPFQRLVNNNENERADAENSATPFDPAASKNAEADAAA